MCIYINIHTYTYMHTYLPTYIHTYAMLIHSYIHPFIHTCMPTYMHAYIHTLYIHAYDEQAPWGLGDVQDSMSATDADYEYGKTKEE